MKDPILRLGCFLTGRNYKIVKSCSEASTKSVKKFLAAILIMSIIWGFIGFTFTQRYIQGSMTASVIVAAIMVFVVIHIERQIILSIGKNKWSSWFRIVIGVVMAIIGSVIIDQILFKQDVEKKKISDIQEEVYDILPLKTNQINLDIANLDTLIINKEREKAQIVDEITIKPFVKSSTRSTIHHNVMLSGKDTLIARSDVTIVDIPNPKASFIPQIETLIKSLQAQKSLKEEARLTMREDLEKDLMSKTGFLDELTTLFSILFSSLVALLVWIALFIFFLALELFVLTNKYGDKGDDYDETIIHQMNIHRLRLAKLEEASVIEVKN